MKGKGWDDHYARRARNENWLARSVYKLQEMDERFTLIRRGNRLLDLGCYPGSWSQYGIRKVGQEGNVIGIDLNKPERLSSKNFRFMEGNVLAIDLEQIPKKITPRDLVMSDMAPATTGISTTDISRSMELAERAFEIACAVLKKKGNFLCKIFEGEGIRTFRSKIGSNFQKIQTIRPKAVRKGSREVYIVGLSFHASNVPVSRFKG